MAAQDTMCNIACYGETKAEKTHLKNVPIKTYLSRKYEQNLNFALSGV